MVVCADTSFLFALYGNDIHTSKAIKWSQQQSLVLSVSELADYELGNALRFAEFRKVLLKGQADSFIAQYEQDRSAGRIQLEVCNLASIISTAKRLSTTYTKKIGHRSFEILHVATALELGATQFLTFDANQKKLAESEGLKVPAS
jgi:predicted nucleic acid-binding protein